MINHFVFTLNNYTTEDVLNLKGCVGVAGIKYIVFGYEICPTTGTPHLQGYLQMNHRDCKKINNKFTSKTLFIVPAKAESGLNAHEMLGDFREPYSARGYSMKTPGFFEAGFPVDIPAREPGKRNDLDAVQQDIIDGKDYLYISNRHFHASTRYGRFFKEQIAIRDDLREKADALERTAPYIIHEWQRRVIDMIHEPASHRIIHWLWSEAGDVGKSTLATYLAGKAAAVVFELGKNVDIAHVWATSHEKKIAIFDIPRTIDEKYVDHLYSVAESLKNGRIMSCKYESKTVFFAPPHVIFFANFSPDMTKWSPDRYNVIKLD